MTRPLPVPVTPAAVAALLHEAVVVGRHGDALVVRRRRPFIPCGVDPRDINRECERCYVVLGSLGDGWLIREIDPANVTPFVDRAAEVVAADEQANRAQRANVKPETKETT